jgi:hypothetical protein
VKTAAPGVIDFPGTDTPRDRTVTTRRDGLSGIADFSLDYRVQAFHR